MTTVTQKTAMDFQYSKHIRFFALLIDGNWIGHREFHIGGAFLLIEDQNVLELARIGTYVQSL